MNKLTVSGVLFVALMVFSLNSSACDSGLRDRIKMTLANAIALQKINENTMLYNMNTGDCEHTGLISAQQDVRKFIPQDEISLGTYNFFRLDGVDSMTALKKIYKIN